MSLCYKVNMDATVLKSTKSVGIGVIVRDHMGDVLAALSTQLLLPLVPLEAEAKAMDVAGFTISISSKSFSGPSNSRAPSISAQISCLWALYKR